MLMDGKLETKSLLDQLKWLLPIMNNSQLPPPQLIMEIIGASMFKKPLPTSIMDIPKSLPDQEIMLKLTFLLNLEEISI
jgi:hypothetical protein